MDARATLIAGAIAMLVAVAAGAFGAHALADSVPPARLDAWQTGARYAAWHALALIATGILMRTAPAARALRIAAALFAAGIVLFSGSLFALVLLDVRAIAFVTPLGGIAFLAGWIAFLAAVSRLSRPTP
jgi:uncharacterized membrane protein YgdD (TMEM256/DUF423 family)